MALSEILTESQEVTRRFLSKCLKLMGLSRIAWELPSHSQRFGLLLFFPKEGAHVCNTVSQGSEVTSGCRVFLGGGLRPRAQSGTSHSNYIWFSGKRYLCHELVERDFQYHTGDIRHLH